MRTLAERQVDGMLLAPSVGALGARAPLPRVRRACRSCCSTASCDVALDQVGCDNEQPTARLVEHLIDLRPPRGSRWRSASRGLSTTDERVRGYRLALEQRRASPFDPALRRRGRLAARPGRARRCTRCSTSPSPPTAVVSGNNFMTIGLLRAIAERGLTRARRHRAGGASTTSSGPTCSRPRLTVIRQPTTELGSRAVELLLSRLEDPSRPSARSAWKRCSSTATHVGARTFTCAARSRNPEGMTLTREFGITLLSIYVGARSGARSRAARRFLR